MNETQIERSRTFTWSNPAETAAQMGRLSGLESLQAMTRGEIPYPPVAEMIGGQDFEVSEGKVVLRLQVEEFHYNPIGSVHGGILAIVLDTAMGCAVHSTLPAGMGYTSLDLTTKFLRPATIGSGVLHCEGVVLSRGRTTALAEARMTDARGKPIAHAISTCALFEIPSQ